MLYVRKGIFEEYGVASAEELNREFNRAADSVSKIDHMMIAEGSVGKTQFVKPYESTRAPSSTHEIVYAEPAAGIPATAVLCSASAVGAPLMDLADVGPNSFMNAVNSATSQPIQVGIHLADIADVLISISCQYVQGAPNPADYLIADLQSVVNGEGSHMRTFGNYTGFYVDHYIGLSLMNSIKLPAGDHIISARVRNRLEDSSGGPATPGTITAMSIFAAGFYR